MYIYIYIFIVTIACDVSCVNCRSRTKYDCTECLTSQVHFLDGQCGNCPLNSTFNSSSGYCQSNIFKYIYIITLYIYII